MWEFCITVSKKSSDIATFIYNRLKQFKNEYDGVLTVYNKDQSTDILVACNNYEKNRLILVLQDVISESICYFYKKQFLINNIKIHIGDEISKRAFISALLFFDKETDRYIVNKYLNIDKKLNLDGFYNFKLQSLKDKWRELIEIANDNEIYLYSNDTFMELLKFLIDNIEIKNDVINIMSTNGSYDICDSKFDKIENDEILENIDEQLVCNLIALCPKNINIYCSDKMPNNIKDIICKLFEKRVKFVSKIN